MDALVKFLMKGLWVLVSPFLILAILLMVISGLKKNSLGESTALTGEVFTEWYGGYKRVLGDSVEVKAEKDKSANEEKASTEGDKGKGDQKKKQASSTSSPRTQSGKASSPNKKWYYVEFMPLQTIAQAKELCSLLKSKRANCSYYLNDNSNPVVWVKATYNTNRSAQNVLKSLKAKKIPGSNKAKIIEPS